MQTATSTSTDAIDGSTVDRLVVAASLNELSTQPTNVLAADQAEGPRAPKAWQLPYAGQLLDTKRMTETPSYEIENQQLASEQAGTRMISSFCHNEQEALGRPTR